MTLRRSALAALVTLSVVATACGDDDAPAAVPAPVTDQSPSAEPSESTIAPTSAPPTSAAPTTAAPAPATIPTVTAPAPVELELAGVGDYGVGRVTLTVDDPERNRAIPVDVWYPIDPERTGTPARYEFTPDIFFDSQIAIADAPVAADGPFPLIVYSHGSGGQRYVASFFTEFVASHGYVVAAPDHVGNTATDAIVGAGSTSSQNAINRPTDISRVIDALTGGSGDAGLAGAVDAERIGVAGHSLGGFTTFALESGFETDDGIALADGRIDAIVAMAPASRGFSDEQLGAIDIPLMLISGTADTTTPVDDNTLRPWRLAGAPLVYRVDLTEAGHQSFTDVCDYQTGLPLIPGIPQALLDFVDDYAAEGCAAELMPIERAHALTNTFALAFFDATVAGDQAALDAIDPAIVAVPDDAVVLVR